MIRYVFQKADFDHYVKNVLWKARVESDEEL